MSEEFDKIEEASFYEEQSFEMPPSDIIAYNELRSCADLLRMFKDGILEIQPEFQREIVWSLASQTRFIDSLIKQLPIPSMCFSLDYKTQKWQVIDGLQRISTIIKFLSEDDWQLSKLDDIDHNISGKTVQEIKDKNSKIHKYYRIVENLTLPITVLRCDYSKKSHSNYLFTIFHRLNTGGQRLNNQEIRNCIYNGSFNSFLKNLNKNTAWREINRIEDDKSYRFKKVELILRFFAYYENSKNYKGRLAKFLNDYMDMNKNLKGKELELKKELFDRTVTVISEKVFDKEIPTKINISLIEALMFGVSKNIDTLEVEKKSIVRGKFEQLKNDDSLSEQTLKGGIADKEKVLARLSAGEKIFSGN